MKIDGLINSQGLDFRLKDESIGSFKWYTIYENNNRIGHVGIIDGINYDVKVNMLFITNNFKGYGTKVLKQVCLYANKKDANNIVICDLLKGGYNLTLNDRINIYKKIGSKLKNEGLVKKVMVAKEDSEKIIVYKL